MHLTPGDEPRVLLASVSIAGLGCQESRCWASEVIASTAQKVSHSRRAESILQTRGADDRLQIDPKSIF